MPEVGDIIQYEFDFEAIKKTGRPAISPLALRVFTVPDTDMNYVYTVYQLRCTGTVKTESCRSFEHAMVAYQTLLRNIVNKQNMFEGKVAGPVHVCWALLVRRDEDDGHIIYSLDSGENLCGEH